MVSWGPGRLDLVVLGADKGLYHTAWESSADRWSEYYRLGSHTFAEQPATISRGPDSIDVFAIGTDSKVYRHSFEKGTWSKGQVIEDGEWHHKPAAISLNNDRYDLFLVGLDGYVYHKRYDAESHSAIKDCGKIANKVRDGVTVASWASDHMDVYCLGFDSGTRYARWNGNAFKPEANRLSSLGGEMLETAAVLALGKDSMEVFARGTDSHLYHRWTGFFGWHDWEKFEGEKLISRPHAVNWGSGRRSLFSINAQRSLIHKKFADGKWHDWQVVSDGCWEIDSVVSMENNRLDIFYRDIDGVVHHKWLKGANWLPAGVNGESLGQPTDASLASQNRVVGAISSPSPSSDSDDIPVRREISILHSRYKEQFDLFIRAFRNLQLRPEASSLSFYGIGSIHGVPYIRWPFEETAREDDNDAGYCCHRSVLFPVWHRTYMLLLEQTIQQEAVEIAKEFTGPFKKVYADAAANLRFPFWDWTINDGALPRAAMYKEISVAHGGPNGVVDFKRIPNPLLGYTFRDAEMHKKYFVNGKAFDQDAPEQVWSDYLQTMRCPNGQGESQHDVVDTQLFKQNRNIREMVYKLMTVNEYQPFASTGYEPGAGNINNTQSLEGIHDGIHVLVGIDPTPLDGHMGDPMYAGFDPIFFLHHCNVDRLFALWSCCHPGVTVEPQEAKETMIFYEKGTVQDENTPLYPYRHPDGKHFTSKEVDDWDATRRWGYRYPEMPQDLLQNGDSEALRKHVCKQVIELFGPKDVSYSNVPTEEVKTANEMNALANKAEPGAVYMKGTFQITSGQYPDFNLEARHRREWLVNLKIENFAVDGSFNIHFFLGDFNPSPLIWTQDVNLVGTHSVFSSAIGQTGCEKCLQDANSNAIVSGGISLTTKLVENGLQDLEPETVIPYLRENLHWRVQMANGKYVQSSQIPSLVVSVSCTIIELPDDQDVLPQWGVPQIFTDVTKDKAGGAQEGTQV